MCFEELGDAFHVFVLGQISFAFQIAIKFNIKLVFFGENGEAEYAGDPNSVDRSYMPSSEWRRIALKGSDLKTLIEYGIKNKDYINKDDINESDLIFYQPPTIEEHNKAGILGAHYFSYYYKKWIPQNNYYYATEHTGFSANPERSERTYSKYASLDDRLDGYGLLYEIHKIWFWKSY